MLLNIAIGIIIYIMLLGITIAFIRGATIKDKGELE
jgi:hypothetical protein